MQGLVLPAPKFIYPESFRAEVFKDIEDFARKLKAGNKINMLAFKQCLKTGEKIRAHMREWPIFYYEPRSDMWREYHHTRAKIILIYGPTRYGKTHGVVADGILSIGGHHPLQKLGQRTLNCNCRTITTMRLIKTVHQPQFLDKLIPPCWIDKKPTKDNNMYVMTNGLIWDFITPDMDSESGMGKSIGWIHEDEEMDDERAHDVALGRIGDTLGTITITQCPEHGSTNWVWFRYYQHREKLQAEEHNGVAAFKFMYTGEKKVDKYYTQEMLDEEMLLAKTEKNFYQKRIIGLPFTTNKLAFPNFVEYAEKIIVPDWTPISYLERAAYAKSGKELAELDSIVDKQGGYVNTSKYISIDPHPRRPYYILFVAFMPPGTPYNIFIYDELVVGGEEEVETERGITGSAISGIEFIKQKLVEKIGFQSISYAVIDTLANSQNKFGETEADHLRSVQQGELNPFQLRGLHIIPALKTDKYQSIRLVQNTLALRKDTGLPDIRVARRCVTFIDQMMNAQHTMPGEFDNPNTPIPKEELVKSKSVLIDMVEAYMYLLRSGACYHNPVDRMEKFKNSRNIYDSRWR